MVAQEGVALYHGGKVAQSAGRFEEAARLAPSIPTIQLNLGFANLALYQAAPKSAEGQKAAEAAIGAFSRYLALRPTEERARVFLLQTFVDTGRYDDAVAFFKPRTEATPPDLEALTLLGIIASKTGRFAEAKGWYERRIALEPTHFDARLALGILLWDRLHTRAELTGVARLAAADEALGHLVAAIRSKPVAPNAWTYANLVYRERSLAATTDDAKRVDLEQAHRFFQHSRVLQSPDQVAPSAQAEADRALQQAATDAARAPDEAKQAAAAAPASPPVVTTNPSSTAQGPVSGSASMLVAPSGSTAAPPPGAPPRTMGGAR
jgi:tetratricopeptide (TPR) repeat protein